MMVPMTTDANDGNPHMQHHPSLSFDNDVCSSHPLNPQQRNEFCNDFLQFVTALKNANTLTTHANISSLTATPVVDSKNWIPVAVNTTYTPATFPTKDNSSHKCSLSVSPLIDFLPRHINNSDVAIEQHLLSSPESFALMQTIHPTMTQDLPQPVPSNNSSMNVPLSTITPQSSTTDAQPTTISTFLSKLESLHNNLIQLIHASSASPSCTSDTQVAPVNDKWTKTT